MIEHLELVAANSQAVSAVLSRWRADFPALGVFVLVPEAEVACVPAIQSVCRELDMPLIGAIFPALIVERGFVTEGIWLIGMDPMPPWFLLDRLNDGPKMAHSRICEAISENLPASNPDTGQSLTLFLIFDAMLPNISSLLNSVFRHIHTAVRYAGVNAGSETFQPMPCLFDRDVMVEQGVIGFLKTGRNVVVEHAYPVAKTLMRATSTTGNRIKVIDGRPALEVYQEVIAADFGVVLTRENFYDYAVHYPFGVVSAADVVVRIPVGFEDDGSIICVGEVPPDSLLRLIKAPALAASQCVGTITRQLTAPSGRAGDELLVFYCAGRRMHFGDDAATELQQLQHETGATRLAGALSLGEIGVLEELGIPQFHNAALVCM